MSTPPIADETARTWCDALEDLQTIHGAFVGLDLLLRNQEDPLDRYQLARVAMIVEVVAARFEALLDTALDGMLALGQPAASRASAVSPHVAEGADA